jgi:hypothetical protein
MGNNPYLVKDLLPVFFCVNKFASELLRAISKGKGQL